MHFNGALNTGSSIGEIKEVILQMLVYSGFPSSINAMNSFKEVVEQRKNDGIIDDVGKAPTPTQKDRFQLGTQELSALDKLQAERLKNTMMIFVRN